MFNLDVSKVDLRGARVVIVWCCCCYVGHHGSLYVSKVYCLLLRWSPCRLVLCACGRGSPWGHCMCQKYAAVAATWATVLPAGAACMLPASADADVCACGRVKAE
jgi:hypothetical protein